MTNDLPSPIGFLKELFNHLKLKNIDVKDLYLDHICYRVASTQRYMELRDQLMSGNKLLVESDVNGRMIATFKLSSPIEYEQRIIDCLELPAPKPGSSYPEGFEHVEFVIKEDFETFMKRYPHCHFNTKAMQKKFNPEIRLDLTDSIAVKFHHMDLEKVIEIESGTIEQ